MNQLFYGDNLAVLREHIKDESVDLVYLDPPFNSSGTYNLLYRSQSGQLSGAQIDAFEDTWKWGEQSEREFDELLRASNTNASSAVRSLRQILGECDMMAYVTMMAVRLLELHRVLKPSGSLYLHCDPTASHYLKVLLDQVFGAERFQSEVVWKRTGAHGRAKRWGPIHDTILFYSKSARFTWNRVYEKYDQGYVESAYRQEDERGRYQLITLDGPGVRRGDSGKPWRDVDPTPKGRHWELPPDRALPAWFAAPKSYAEMTVQQRLDVLDAQQLIYWPTRGSVPRFKRYLSIAEGNPVQDIVTDIAALSSQAAERIGYPTQKPQMLLERIIAASSNEGDVVLDPFCGCGTAVHAAESLRRRWIGIDVTHLAIAIIEKRMKDAFPGGRFEVHGVPEDLEGAIDLAARDKYQFQWWACSLVNAQPYAQKKKGADGGIDGLIYFVAHRKESELIVVSVKAGANVSVQMVRDLRGVLEREGSPIGLFVTLTEPTGPMETEAAKAGFVAYDGERYPRIQILTIEKLLAGKARPRHPGASLDPHPQRRRVDLSVETSQGELFAGVPKGRIGEVFELSGQSNGRDTQTAARAAVAPAVSRTTLKPRARTRRTA